MLTKRSVFSKECWNQASLVEQWFIQGFFNLQEHGYHFVVSDLRSHHMDSDFMFQPSGVMNKIDNYRSLTVV